MDVNLRQSGSRKPTQEMCTTRDPQEWIQLILSQPCQAPQGGRETADHGMEICVQILFLPLTSFLTLGKAFNLLNLSVLIHKLGIMTVIMMIMKMRVMMKMRMRMVLK